MSKNLRIGDQVEIEVGGRVSLHAIVARKLTAQSRSGVSYRLMPPYIPSPWGTEWVDAGFVRRAKGYGRFAEEGENPFPEVCDA